MKDRIVGAVLSLVFLAMCVAFAAGTREVRRHHQRGQDYAQWVEHPGRLRSLELHETLYRLRWRWEVACAYDVLAPGGEVAAGGFDLAHPRFDSADEAKAYVEAALGIAGRARWAKKPYGSADAWALDAAGLALRVRHSPRDPTAATLTATPPPHVALDWVVLAVLAALALATGAGALAMLAAAIRGEPPVRSPRERARGEEDLPLLPPAVRERYASRLQGAIAALEALREAEGPLAEWDAVLSELRDELDVARRGPMRRRRHGLHLSRRLDLGCTTRAQERLQHELDKVDAFLREHVVVREAEAAR